MQHNLSQSDKLKQNREKLEQQQAEIHANMIKVCSEAFSGTNGKYLGKFIRDICKWSDPTQENIDVNGQVLAYQKGRRDIWVILREFIDKKDLAEIEIFD